MLELTQLIVAQSMDVSMVMKIVLLLTKLLKQFTHAKIALALDLILKRPKLQMVGGRHWAKT
jgi:hypothetical protein